MRQLVSSEQYRLSSLYSRVGNCEENSGTCLPSFPTSSPTILKQFKSSAPGSATQANKNAYISIDLHLYSYSAIEEISSSTCFTDSCHVSSSSYALPNNFSLFSFQPSATYFSV
jgi:hypothetical protein